MNICNATLASLAPAIERLLNSNLQPERAGQPLTQDQLDMRKIRRAASSGEGSLTGAQIANMHRTHALANQRAMQNGNLVEIRSQGRMLTDDGHWVPFASQQEKDNQWIQENRNLLQELWRLLNPAGHNFDTTI